MPKLSEDRNLPNSVTRYSFGYALRNCGVPLIDAFDKSSANPLYVYDDHDLGYTEWTNVEPDFVSKCFKVFNPNGNEIVLLPTDGRIIKAKDVIEGGICDCILVTDNYMCLVEFKTNATSTELHRIYNNAIDAMDQLWHTFDGILVPKCIAVSKDIKLISEIEFHVVFDKDLDVTSAKSSLMDLQNEFLDDHGYTLFFDNEKEFI